MNMKEKLKTINPETLAKVAGTVTAGVCVAAGAFLGHEYIEPMAAASNDASQISGALVGGTYGVAAGIPAGFGIEKKLGGVAGLTKNYLKYLSTPEDVKQRLKNIKAIQKQNEKNSGLDGIV